MKSVSLCLLMFSTFCCLFAKAQSPSQAGNVFIITTDGFRWQEIFSGADPAILSNTNYVSDTLLMQQFYGDSTAELRRQKLMPFFWNVIAKKGQVYGNRLYGSKVNVSNFYKISYPGYNEILTGYADPRFIPNSPKQNRNITILEHLNTLDAYKGKVAAFCSWNIFPYIFNEKRSHIPVNGGYEMLDEEGDTTNMIINQAQKNVAKKRHTRYDQLTFLGAKEYITTHHPKVLMLALGETDEYAHEGRYDLYLQQANAVDKMLAELWYLVQTDDFYKNNTTFIITTDHGRGSKKDTWANHNLFVKGSGETWMALLGAGIAPGGEERTAGQLYQKQVASTVALLLGENFETKHTVGKPLTLQHIQQPMFNSKPPVATIAAIVK